MKRLILILALLTFNLPVFASDDAGPANVAGAKLDMPNLVRFNQDLTLGTEVSKDLYQRLNSDWRHENGDRGWTGYVKVTYTGSLINLSK